MKATIDRTLFAQVLEETVPFIPKKPTIKILKYAKITTKDVRMKIEATDTQVSITKYLKLESCDEDKTFLLDISDVYKFLQKLKCDTIELSVEDNTVFIKHPKGKAQFQIEDAENYPMLKNHSDDIVELELPSSYLSSCISYSKLFVSNDIIRPIMCASYAYIKGNEFGFCATDTGKLIHGTYNYAYADDLDVNWFIMPSVFSALEKACKGSENVKIQITDNFVSYRIGSTIIQSIQTKGKYPNFKRVIPTDNSIEMTLTKEDLKDAIDRVALFCNESNCIKFDIHGNIMDVNAEDLTSMKEAAESVNIENNGPDIKLGLSSVNINACLSVFDKGDITIKMNDPSRPVLFGQKEKDNLVVLCMPMQINN